MKKESLLLIALLATNSSTFAADRKLFDKTKQVINTFASMKHRDVVAAQIVDEFKASIDNEEYRFFHPTTTHTLSTLEILDGSGVVRADIRAAYKKFGR